MPKSRAILLFTLGALVLFATEIIRVYLIMPFPGSQRADTVKLAWSINHYRYLLRALGLILVALPLLRLWRKARTGGKIALGTIVLFYCVVFYFFNFRFEADKMFYQPGHKAFAQAADNKIPLNKLVIGVVAGDEARAYPIQLIGYHHQVRDTVGGIPVMITYCTVCRTGRVYSPTVKGHLEDFRLVGMDHFNAMFEDAATGSWWQQATGESVAGPLTGTRLAELTSTQVSLREWLYEHPDSKVLQPDTVFKKDYADLADYDIGTIKGSLEKRDSGSWKMKSWVVGVRSGRYTKAYDWNVLVTHTMIQDTVGATPVLLLLDPDSVSFHTWNRREQGQILTFEKIPGQPLLRDTNTGSQWNTVGLCISGPLKDQQLEPVQSYQEFWHSWSHFHPSTTRYQQ
ncbi:MAG TPA: DUF3179 domain-containing (seleno)protein [Puia sp.]|nr:DUF3179 domain-containing (seleno)protein [Puia sp.]